MHEFSDKFDLDPLRKTSKVNSVEPGVGDRKLETCINEIHVARYGSETKFMSSS